MNNAAIEELYNSRFDCIYRYALAITGSHAAAEEITQEAFTRLLNNGSSKGKIERPAAWLMRVARNLAMESFRIQRRTPPQAISKAPMNPEQILLASELQRRVLSGIMQLTESQRHCLALREYGDLSYEEIAGILGTSTDQVKVQLFRARRNLIKHLEDLA